jgi:hypothetical protein
MGVVKSINVQSPALFVTFVIFVVFVVKGQVSWA